MTDEIFIFSVYSFDKYLKTDYSTRHGWHGPLNGGEYLNLRSVDFRAIPCKDGICEVDCGELYLKLTPMALPFKREALTPPCLPDEPEVCRQRNLVGLTMLV